jgi:hypothetical protein
MLRKTSIVIAFIAFGINVLLLCFYSGYQEGYEEAYKLYNTSTLFSTPGLQTPFQYHFKLVFCSIVLIFGVWLRKALFSHIISLLSVTAMLFIYSGWFNNLLANDELPFSTNLQNSVSIFDGMSLTITIGLFLLQIIVIYQYFFDKGNKPLITL